jgi:hypothetical protein
MGQIQSFPFLFSKLWMKAKQRYQLFHLCVRRDPAFVRRHNTGIDMELRSSPKSFVRLLIFGVLDSHDGVSGFGYSHGNRLEEEGTLF